MKTIHFANQGHIGDCIDTTNHHTLAEAVETTVPVKGHPWFRSEAGQTFLAEFGHKNHWDHPRHHRAVYARSTPRHRPSKKPHIVASGRI